MNVIQISMSAQQEHTNAVIMPYVITPREHTTAHVIQDLLEMDTFVEVMFWQNFFLFYDMGIILHQPTFKGRPNLSLSLFQILTSAKRELTTAVVMPSVLILWDHSSVQVMPGIQYYGEI